ncbi:MAG: hypothetical protein H6719_36970 [Sandaracinaceae bacterium]|nr:hypothetical protein [Sandaracinaceae bacterium]
MIPDWNAQGVIPPIAPGEPRNSGRRAPYLASLRQVVDRYGTTPERRKILRGLIDYRRALAAAGLPDGFQWLNGSFMEDVEASRARPPADIDVVSFVPLGNGANQQNLLTNHPDVFDPDRAKAKFHVDAYFRSLDDALSDRSVRAIAYWYSMWAHRRDDQLWKGFVEVAMSDIDDAEAGQRLNDLEAAAAAKVSP